MEEKRLEEALENLVTRGEVSREVADAVLAEFERTPDGRNTRQKILSEVGGYLGGLFIFIALLILVGGRWQHISHYLQAALFLAFALLLGGAALLVGKSTSARTRLAGLLGALAAASTTATIFAWRVHGDGPILFAFAIGAGVSLLSFLWNRSMIGELALAGFAIATGTAGMSFATHDFRGVHGFASVLLVVGMVWLYFSNTGFFNRKLGDAIAISALFLSGQLFFSSTGGLRILSYVISAGTAVAAVWIYSRTPEWPLLVGAVASITVGTGELVGTTLGGSLGATLGLLTSGVIFVSASVYSFRNLKKES